MSNAEHGVIFFSFGTFMKTSEMPQEKMIEIIESFKNIKQKVLMRTDIDIPDLPANIMTRRWFSQNAVLAHPNTVLFITHGEKTKKF
jgi:glucuronosyltransferase